MPLRRPLRELDRSDWIFLAAGVVALVVVVLIAPPETLSWSRIYLSLSLWVVLVAFISVFSDASLTGHPGLESIFILGAYLVFDVEPAAWVALLGALLTELSQPLWATWLGLSPRTAPQAFVYAASRAVRQVFSLLIGVLCYRLVGGRVLLVSSINANLLPLLVLALVHFLTNNLIFAALMKIKGQMAVLDYFRRNARTLVWFKLAPLPAAALVAALYQYLGVWLFAGICLYLVVIMVSVFKREQARAGAEQRVRQLTGLSAISGVMRASLDLPELLEAIHKHIGELLDARGFYFALYDSDSGQVSFPLYYEAGEKQHVRPRPANVSMAGHVIHTRQPLLVRENLKQTSEQLGVALQDSAQSWLGVPILADGRALGAIAVHSPDPRAYDHSHVELLTTVAVQVAVAINNAQLYSTLRQRAAEMAILNSVSTAITETLDLDRVLHIIVSTVGPLTGCQKSAIFLLSDTGTELDLAQSIGLSTSYVEGAHRLKVAPDERGMVAARRRAIFVPDLFTSTGFEVFIPIAKAEGFRAVAEVPMLARNSVIGTLAVYYTDMHPFTLAEMDLLQTFANQAAAAVNNARLHERTDQALARRVEELSALEVIGREFAGTLDVARIADRIAEWAVHVTNAQMAALVLADEVSGGGVFMAQRGYPVEWARPYVQEPWPMTQGILGRVLRTGVLANVPEVRLDPDYVAADSRVHSQLSVPIVREGRVMGVITMESHKPYAFDSATVAFTQQLANQAAVALENARLFDERTRRINELSQLHQASLALTSSLDLRQVLVRIVNAAHQLTGADTIALNLYYASSDMFLPGATAGIELPGSSTEGIRPHGMTRRALQQHRSILVGDTHQEPDVNKRLVAIGVRSMILVPVISHDQVLGVLNAYSQRTFKFTDADVQLVSALGNQAAAAIENARLFQDVAQVRDRLSAILNSSREGILMFDMDGRMVLVNPAVEKLLGIQREMVEGRLLTEILGSGLDIATQLGYSPPAILASLDQFRQSQHPQEMQDIYQLARPAPHFIERSGIAVRDTSGKTAGWMIVLRDVTEERELQQMRNDLTSMIIHDLRSPLSAIYSGLLLLREIHPASRTDLTVQDTLTIAEQSCLKLIELVNSLLDIGKLEAGRMELLQQSTDLSKLVGGVLDGLTPLAQEQGIKFECRIGEPWSVFVDEEKIGRVLTNLVDNAIKFTPPDGQVTIMAEPMPGEVGRIRCGVRDTGAGIPAEYRERIFERFAQGPGKGGNRRRGTGLGLTFCRLMVEAHGGRIWLESESGQGSTFYFTLPLA